MAVNSHLEIQIDNRQRKQKEDNLLNDLLLKVNFSGKEGGKYIHIQKFCFI